MGDTNIFFTVHSKNLDKSLLDRYYTFKKIKVEMVSP